MTTCPLCDAGSSELRIATLAHTHVMLAETQGCLGWCVCVLRGHVEHLDELDIDVQRAIFSEVALVARAIRAWSVEQGPEWGLPRADQPPRINYGCLGNIVGHVHWHVIPRHANDPEPRSAVWGWSPQRLAGELLPQQCPALIAQLRAQLA